MKILLLKKNSPLTYAICEYLISVFHTVDYYEKDEDIMNIIHNVPYDMYLIDIPSNDSFEFNYLKIIRENYSKALIIVTSSNQSIESVASAFITGCNDYLKKPFHLKELELRINRFIPFLIDEKSSIIALNEYYTFDTKTSTLFYEGKAQYFTKNESYLISLFIENRNTILTEKQISLYIWNDSMSDYTKIRSLIRHVRKKLRTNFIQNIRGLGYMWVDI